MDKAKYIVVEENGTETPIIFPCWMLHANMAGDKKVVSAGVVRIYLTNVAEANLSESEKAWDAEPMEIRAVCYGESVGLFLKSRPQEDAELIEKTILNCGE